MASGLDLETTQFDLGIVDSMVDSVYAQSGARVLALQLDMFECPADVCRDRLGSYPLGCALLFEHGSEWEIVTLGDAIPETGAWDCLSVRMDAGSERGTFEVFWWLRSPSGSEWEAHSTYELNDQALTQISWEHMPPFIERP